MIVPEYQIFLISFWTKVNDLSSSKFLISRGVYLDNGWYLSAAVDGRVYVRINSSGDYYTAISSAGMIQEGQWVYVTVVLKNGSYTDYYFDGNFNRRDSSSFTYSNSSSEVFNLGSYSIPGYFLEGLLDDVRIYNRALSKTEIELLYKSVK